MSKFKTILILIVVITLNAIAIQTVLASEKSQVVVITSDCCSTCQKLKPVIEDLKYSYEWQIDFVVVNLSSRASLEEAKQIAEERGFTQFLEEHKATLPTVGILCPGGKVEKVFIGETRKEVYTQALDELLLDSSKLCSL